MATSRTSLAKAAVQSAQADDARLIPRELFNLFYRDENALKLNELRDEVMASRQHPQEALESPQAIDTPMKM
ncbi:MAG TPA: hypothetical protein VGO53_09340 [Steroidobacteraceae bacterium]|nr:hypothetical protein [Steroidobacteraceae bacterium]